jgi:hypothetical protein
VHVGLVKFTSLTLSYASDFALIKWMILSGGASTTQLHQVPVLKR